MNRTITEETSTNPLLDGLDLLGQHVVEVRLIQIPDGGVVGELPDVQAEVHVRVTEQGNQNESY